VEDEAHFHLVVATVGAIAVDVEGGIRLIRPNIEAWLMSM
jgi:hypothetical protein